MYEVSTAMKRWAFKRKSLMGMDLVPSLSPHTIRVAEVVGLVSKSGLMSSSHHACFSRSRGGKKLSPLSPGRPRYSAR